MFRRCLLSQNFLTLDSDFEDGEKKDVQNSLKTHLICMAYHPLDKADIRNKTQ